METKCCEKCDGGSWTDKIGLQHAICKNTLCPCHQPKEKPETITTTIDPGSKTFGQPKEQIEEIGELIYIEANITGDQNLSYGLGVMKDKIDEIIRHLNRKDV